MTTPHGEVLTPVYCPVGTVATAAFRQAENGLELLNEVSELLRIPCRILSGEEEAALAYLAVRSLYRETNLWVLDLGGGSTEIHNGLHRKSFPVGAVGFTERFAADSEAMVREARAIFSPVTTAFGETGNAHLIAVGGTASALALLEQGLPRFDADAVEGFAASLPVVSRWRKRLAVLSVTEHNSLPGLDGNRGEIFVAGLAIWEGFLLASGFSDFRVSDRGLRYGLLWQNWKEEPACA